MTDYAPRAEVLVVNAGSTSLKLRLVDAGERSEPVEDIDGVDPDRLAAVAHRVVHGGPRFRDPVLIDEEVRERIFALEPLAPLHNAPALEQIDRARAALPGVPQVAVFDTGFHGLSVAWSAERAPQLLERPAANLRLVVCHLGGGCSVSAVRGGRSVDTTMGFSPLEGVPMSTRSGSVDPGALAYLMRERGLGPAELERTLELDSGLRGLAGGSGDMLAVERAAAAGEADALFALDVFAHRVAGAVAAMAASAGGLDALAFTAGIGEASAPTRARICARLAFLGVELDPERNATAEPDCDAAADSSPVRALVIRAREDLIAARAARQLLASP